MQQVLASPRVYFNSQQNNASVVTSITSKILHYYNVKPYTFPHHTCKLPCGNVITEYEEYESAKASVIPKLVKSIVCPNENCKRSLFVCLFCTYTAQKNSQMQQHMTTNHSYSHCQHCDYKFPEATPKEIFHHYISTHIACTPADPLAKRQKTRCYDLPCEPLETSKCNDIPQEEPSPLPSYEESLQAQLFNETFANKYYELKGKVDFIPPVEYEYKESKPIIEAAIQAAQIQQDLPKLTAPDRNQPFTNVFPTFEWFHFTVVDYLLNNVAEQQADCFLHSLHNAHLKDNRHLYPQSMYHVKEKLKNLPIPSRINFADSKYRKLSVPQFSIRDLIARTLNAEELMAEMQFKSSMDSTDTVSQFVESLAFKKLAAKCDKNSLPIAVMIFYDDFQKNKKTPGKCGGFYCAVLNLNRKQRSKTVNIYGLALIENEKEYYNAVHNLVTELKELYSPHHARLALFKAFAKIQVVCPLLLADMPQRHDNCCLVGLTSNNAPCCHCNESSSRLHVTPSKNNEATVFAKSLRTVPKVLALLAEYNSGSSAVRKQLIVTHGVKFWQTEQDKIITNPLWDLYNLYEVDVFQAHVVDFFHVSILGLLRKHFKSMIKHVFNETEKKQIETNIAKHTVAGHSLLALKYIKFWNGDQWLRFMAVSPFILSNIMCSDARLQEHFKCWIQHIDWVIIMLKPKLTRQEILHAEQLCWNWRKQMLQLFGAKKVATPNFHAVLHVFPQALLYGPPSLYWARPFEHKHAVYRGFIENSNNRNVGKFCMEKEKIVDCVLYLFPNVKIMKPVKKTVRTHVAIGDEVNIIVGPEVQWGTVLNIREGGSQVVLKTYHWRETTMKHGIHKCLKVSTMNTGVCTVQLAKVVRRFTIVDDYINRFEVLDMTKL